jgi:hypothetical protein
MARPFPIKGKSTGNSKQLVRIVFFMSVITLVICGFIYTILLKEQPDDAPLTPKTKYLPIYAEDLGKTPKDIQARYPDLFLRTNRFGVMTGKQVINDAQYTIWFVKEDADYKAFRLQTKKIYSHLDEQEIANDFAKLYSRPVDSSCTGKSAYAQNKCHYKWWVRQNVTLDLYSRFMENDRVEIRAITSDSYLVSKHYQQVKSVLPTQ